MVSTELNFHVIYLFVVNELNSISQDFQLENFIQDLMYNLSVPFIFLLSCALQIQFLFTAIGAAE